MTNNPPLPLLCEALEYKDLVGMMKPTVHVDEFSSKMGDDDDIIVLSFFLRSKNAARDLMNWFEKGYDWVMDADQSPGEIRPGRYLVYVEMRRRSRAGESLARMIDDLNTLTEYQSDDWTLHYQGKDVPFSRDNFEKLVPLSPKEYRRRKEKDLNEVRVAAGLQAKTVFERDAQIQSLQASAGI